jgi:hypothetical protein
MGSEKIELHPGDMLHIRQKCRILSSFRRFDGGNRGERKKLEKVLPTAYLVLR